jgi:hypothetical protein
MGLVDTLEGISWIVVLASFAVGFYESIQDFGEVTSVLDSIISSPTTTGLGFGIFAISLDTWTPCIPVSMLPWYLKWLSMPYFFAGGEFISTFLYLGLHFWFVCGCCWYLSCFTVA